MDTRYINFNVKIHEMQKKKRANNENYKIKVSFLNFLIHKSNFVIEKYCL